jgi:Activator of Hsp90 ATPase homolog 1-like protein
MPRGCADLRHHGVAYGRPQQRPAGDALLGRFVAERNGADVLADECLPFGALAEVDLQPAKGPRLDTVTGEYGALRSQHSDRLESLCSNQHQKEQSHMVDILHKAGIKPSSVNDAYQALTTLKGLSGWWTDNTHGETKVGGVIQFRFGAGGIDMKVLELDPARRVLWQVVDGPAEWIGTKVSFDLRQEGDWTIVFFKHAGWKEPVEFMHHCSTKWGVFLLSLKSLLETGKGRPAPNDIKLDSWE